MNNRVNARRRVLLGLGNGRMLSLLHGHGNASAEESSAEHWEAMNA
jgi:hypothetical protein